MSVYANDCGMTRTGARRCCYVRPTTAVVLATAAFTLMVAAEAASTGGVGTAVKVGAAAAPVDPIVAESKKTAGKAGLMDGYARTGSYKGNKGYNEDDVYGDKDSDSYGFGTQVAFGSKAGDGGQGAYHESSSYDDNGQSNPKYSAWHFEDKDGKPTKRYVYDSQKKKADPPAVEAEASEYDSVEAYDDGDDGGSPAGFEAEEAEPEYGNLYDSADVYNDADSYY